jgi:two-component SAPR family response regulator
MLMLPHDCSPIIDSETARYRLLYVGEDQEFFRALRGILKWPEYHIVSCPHVGTAILFLEGNPRYDLLILEAEVRGKSGLKLARQTRSMAHRSHIPIVIVSPDESAVDINKRRRQRNVNKWVYKEDVSTCIEAIRMLLASTRRRNPASVSGTASS